MFKKGFTLSEILVTLMIIAIVAAVMLRNLKTENYSEQANMANALKTIDAIEQASIKIRDLEKTSCPSGNFMQNVTGTYVFTLLNVDGDDDATSEDVVELFGRHIKFEDSSLSFCDYTSYCDDDTIIGAKMIGDVYIGFKVDDAIGDCPSYYMPNDATEISPPSILNPRTRNFEVDKCWGKVYIDVNGAKAPDALGQDVFVFGMNSVGLAK